MADDTTKKKARKNIRRPKMPQDEVQRLAHLIHTDKVLEKVFSQLPVFPEDKRWSPRRSSRELRARMMKFKTLYSAAWFVRYASASNRSDYRQQKIDAFWNAVLKQLKDCDDREALLYAVADSITAFPHGLPWES